MRGATSGRITAWRCVFWKTWRSGCVFGWLAKGRFAERNGRDAFFSAVDKVCQLVDVEIRLKRTRKEYPDWFVKEEKDADGAGLVIRDERGHEKMLVMEVVLGFYLSGLLYLPSGRPAGLVDAVRWGECWSGGKLPDYRVPGSL